MGGRISLASPHCCTLIPERGREDSDRPKFSKEQLFFFGILELMVLILISCNIFLLGNWDQSMFQQSIIICGTAICLLLGSFICHVFLAFVWFNQKLSKTQVTVLCGICVFLFLVLISCIIFQMVAALCPIPWVGYGERCYFLSGTEANWTHSQNHCTFQGGSLVTLETPEEKDFVQRHRERIGYWIGFWRKGLSQPWMQQNGSLFDKLFPIRGEGLCAYVMDQEISSTWCGNTRFWICSKLAHSVTAKVQQSDSKGVSNHV